MLPGTYPPADCDACSSSTSWLPVLVDEVHVNIEFHLAQADPFEGSAEGLFSLADMGLSRHQERTGVVLSPSFTGVPSS